MKATEKKGLLKRKMPMNLDSIQKKKTYVGTKKRGTVFLKSF